MKANLQHLSFDNTSSSFSTYWVRSPRFDFHWHYHPEIEICYVHQGHGTRLVGDNVSEFQEGDLVLVGSNLPHTWISDEDFNTQGERMEVVVIQFQPALLAQFSNLPEFEHIEQLIEISKRGLFFPNIDTFQKAVIDVVEQQSIEKLLRLFSILNEMSKCEFELLASSIYSPILGAKHERRIREVCGFVHEHFMEDIKLEQIAGIANMNETAFCRFFKKATGKTLLQYTNDLRIGHACNLLIGSKSSVSEIAYEVGFNNLAHFNRSFLKRKGVSPRVFRKRFS